MQLQAELWGTGACEGVRTLCITNGSGAVAQPGEGHSETQQEPPTPRLPSIWAVRSRTLGLLLFKVPPQRHPAPAVTFFLHHDEIILRIEVSETLIWENWGQASEEKLSDWECGLCSCEGSGGERMAARMALG